MSKSLNINKVVFYSFSKQPTESAKHSWSVILFQSGMRCINTKKCVCVFTYKDKPVYSRVLPELLRLIQLVQLVNPLQHHLVAFICKRHYAL